jgi:hypothetical protein
MNPFEGGYIIAAIAVPVVTPAPKETGAPSYVPVALDVLIGLSLVLPKYLYFLKERYS